MCEKLEERETGPYKLKIDEKKKKKGLGVGQGFGAERIRDDEK